MCGIVGAIAQRDVAEILLKGLQRLEYRGYDSAGVAIVDPSSSLTHIRRLGKVQILADAMKNQVIKGGTGIAHTRWATHGEPSQINAHPHLSDNIAVVHNGIIENHASLKSQLQARGYEFYSQTDTEVIAHLIHWENQTCDSLLQAVQKTIAQLEGAYGMLVINSKDPSQMIASRSGSPIIIGLGIGENFIASDQLALSNVTQRFIYLEEGDVAQITRNNINIYQQGHLVQRNIIESHSEFDFASKGQYRHFMQKEIFEQPAAIINTLEGRLSNNQIITNSISFHCEEWLSKIDHVQIVACGTSFNAGMTAKYWFESICNISCDVDIASEFRYRKTVCRPNSLLLTISQSGETADTLAALRLAKEKNYLSTMTICNVATSSLVRESEFALLTRAGAEIGVASTKAFTTQLCALLLLVGSLAKLKNHINDNEQAKIIQELLDLPLKIKDLLKCDDDIEKIAQEFADKEHTLFLGRGELYPIAMEAALKLKEISYIHAQAYAAGELKHGPIALIDAEMPVVILAPDNALLDKIKSNIEEIRARGGKLYIFTQDSCNFKPDKNTKIMAISCQATLTQPIYYAIAMQLLAYHVAVIKGTDVDQPRNLAKSVTVE